MIQEIMFSISCSELYFIIYNGIRLLNSKIVLSQTACQNVTFDLFINNISIAKPNLKKIRNIFEKSLNKTP